MLPNPLNRMRAIVDKEGKPTQVMQLFSEQLKGFLLNPEFSDGISFGNVINSAKNVLNYFYEDDYLPEAIGLTTPGSATYSIQEGRYQRVGNKCHAIITLSWSGHTGSGNLAVSLPMTSSSSLSYSPVTCYNQGIPRLAGQIIQPVIRPSMNVIDFSFSEITGLVSPVSIQASVSALILYACYEVD